MRHLRGLLIAVILTLALAAGGARADALRTGKVTDTAGAPVPGARVLCCPLDGTRILAESLTDADGAFPLVDSPKPLVYYARAEGYAWGRSPAPEKPDSPVAVVLTTPAAITGCVVNRAGKGLPDARIYALNLIYTVDGRELAVSGELPLPFIRATTGADGHFVLDSLPLGGHCILRVEAPDGYANIHVPLSYGPGLLSLPIPSDDFRIVLDPARRISGILTHRINGRPAAGVAICATLRHHYEGAAGGRVHVPFLSSAVTDDRGLFTIDHLIDGRYEIVGAPGEDWGGVLVPLEPADLTDRRAIEGLELWWTEGVDFAARVADAATGDPVPFARFALIETPDAGRASRAYPFYTTAYADREGRLSLRVIPGPSLLSCARASYESLRLPIKVLTHAPSDERVIPLTPQVVASALVLDAEGKPLPRAVVRLLQRPDAVFLADEDGRVSLRLDQAITSAGDALVTSRDGRWTGIVKLPPAGGGEARWELVRAATAAGRVELNGGVPVFCARVLATAVDVPDKVLSNLPRIFPPIPVAVDADGLFEIAGLLPDRGYTLAAWGPGVRPATLRFRTVGHARADLPPVVPARDTEGFLRLDPSVVVARARPAKPALPAADGSQPAAPAPRQVRVAVLPGEGPRDPLAALVEACEVALTREPAAVLVERTQIQKILDEQQLAVSGLVDPRTATRVAHLLPVDAFLFVDRIRAADVDLHRCLILETATGITLGSALFTLEDFYGREPAAVQWIRHVLARQRTAPEDRRYVAVAGFRSEEPVRALEDLAQCLGSLLSLDLSHSPAVVLLDRDYLPKLRDEKDLTGVGLKLRASSTLIDGGLRHAGSRGGGLILAMRLAPLGGGRDQLIDVPIPSDDLPAARRAIETAVHDALRRTTPPPAQPNVVVESARLIRLGSLLAANNALDDAVRAAQAAYALNPSDQTRMNLARTWSRVVPSGIADSGYTRYNQAERLRVLTAYIRAQQLRAEQADIEMLRIERGYDARFSSFASAHDLIPLTSALSSVETGPALALQKEALKLDRDLLRKTSAFCRRHLRQFEDLYWDLLVASLSRTCVGTRNDAEAETAVYQEFIDAWTDACAELAKTPILDTPPHWHPDPNSIPPSVDAAGRRVQVILRLAQNSAVPRRYMPERAAQCDAYKAFFQKMTHHADPCVRVVACAILIRLGDPLAPETMFSIFPREIKLDSAPFRAPSTSPRIAELLAEGLIAYGLKQPDAASDWCDKNLGPFIALPIDFRVLITVREPVAAWLSVLENANRYDKATALGDRILAAMATLKPAQASPLMLLSPQAIAQRRSRYPGAPAPTGPVEPDPARSPWTRYTVTPVSLGGRGSDTLQCVRIIGDSAYIVFSDFRTADFRISKFPFPAGGAPAYEIHFKLPVLPGQTDPGLAAHQVTGIARTAKKFFLGTRAGILEVDETAQTTRLYGQADGCPTVAITALTAHEGKLYFSAGDDRTALYSYDYFTAKADLLASSTVAVPRNPLDGKRLEIRNLISDPERRCIWICDRSLGLWRYRPQDGLVEPIPVRSVFPTNISLLPQGLLCSGETSGIAMLDPVTLKEECILSVFGANIRKDRFPANFRANGGVHVWPAAADADSLFLGVFGVFLVDRRSPDWVWPGLLPGATGQAISSFESSPHGLLAVSRSGQTWLIQRRSAP